MTKSLSRPLRIVTWNVNSVRARLDLIDRFITKNQPDILCLQEIKVQTDMFPRQWFEKRGFSHCAIHGQRNHHGVAILSRLPLADIDSRDWCNKGDARHIASRLPNGVMLHNFYVPAGGDEPDRDNNPRFAHKLDFLDEMIDWSSQIKEPAILVGDLNVAPLETDVWSHKQLLKVVSHTPPETERIEHLMASHDWVDAMRHFVPREERLYSWWSYRAKNWRLSNRGRRLDHVLVSPTLKDNLAAMTVFDEARDWDKPSDHAPVIVDIALT